MGQKIFLSASKYSNEKSPSSKLKDFTLELAGLINEGQRVVTLFSEQCNRSRYLYTTFESAKKEKSTESYVEQAA